MKDYPTFNNCYFVWAGCFVSMTGMFFWQQTKAGATHGRVWILSFSLDLEKPHLFDDTAAHMNVLKFAVSEDPCVFEKGPVHALCWCST